MAWGEASSPLSWGLRRPVILLDRDTLWGYLIDGHGLYAWGRDIHARYAAEIALGYGSRDCLRGEATHLDRNFLGGARRLTFEVDDEIGPREPAVVDPTGEQPGEALLLQARELLGREARAERHVGEGPIPREDRI